MSKTFSRAGKDSNMESKYKASVRNALLTNIFANVIEKVDGKTYKKYLLNPFGLQEMYFELTPNGKRKEVGQRKIVADNIDDALKFFFNGVTFKEADTAESLISAFKSNKFKYPKLRQKIYADFIDHLRRNKIPMAGLETY
jgi:hypothetical protein